MSLIILAIAFGPVATLVAIAIYSRAALFEIKALRKELEHRAENEIRMFNANREASGLPPL